MVDPATLFPAPGPHSVVNKSELLQQSGLNGALVLTNILNISACTVLTTSPHHFCDSENFECDPSADAGTFVPVSHMAGVWTSSPYIDTLRDFPMELDLTSLGLTAGIQCMLAAIGCGVPILCRIEMCSALHPNRPCIQARSVDVNDLLEAPLQSGHEQHYFFTSWTRLPPSSRSSLVALCNRDYLVAEQTLRALQIYWPNDLSDLGSGHILGLCITSVLLTGLLPNGFILAPHFCSHLFFATLGLMGFLRGGSQL